MDVSSGVLSVQHMEKMSVSSASDVPSANAVTDPVTGYSFVCKLVGSDSANVVTVYGRRDGSAEWERLGDDVAITTTMTTTAKALEAFVRGGGSSNVP